jgi:hypothetical protein
MGVIIGWFYLHTNNELIYKNDPDAITDIRESDFCKAAWSWNGSRGCAWAILIEAGSIGANKDRIKELAQKWGCNNDDAKNYAEHQAGIILEMDASAFVAKRTDFVNLQESPCGFGESFLDAMSDLCKQLGYVGGKTWGNSFANLLTH